MTVKRVGVGERNFGSHVAAIAACREALGENFEVIEEVALSSSQVDGKTLRADLLAVEKGQQAYIIALEVKPSFYRMSEYAHALKQAVDYRLAKVCDARLPEIFDRRVSAAFVFPRWHGGHDQPNEYQREALGMERLCHHFRVGAASYRQEQLTLVMNDSCLWARGVWSGNSEGVLGGRERIGSMKVIDLERVRP